MKFNLKIQFAALSAINLLLLFLFNISIVLKLFLHHHYRISKNFRIIFELVYVEKMIPTYQQNYRIFKESFLEI